MSLHSQASAATKFCQAQIMLWMAQACLPAALQAHEPKQPADRAATPPHGNTKSVRTAPHTSKALLAWRLLMSLRAEGEARGSRRGAYKWQRQGPLHRPGQQARTVHRPGQGTGRDRARAGSGAGHRQGQGQRCRQGQGQVQSSLQCC